MKPVNKLVLLSKSKVAGRYMIHYLLPLLIAVTVTFLTVRYVNNFIRTQNEHFSEAIVSQLQQDLNDIISEAEQVALAYTTNLYFFDQLDTILASGNVSISQLETLRTLERNVTITQAVRPHIYSIYFCPEANDTGAFLVAQDGIAYLNTYYDADFIRQARGAAADGLTLRGIKRGTALHTSFLTYVAHTTKSMISRVAGTVILNMDVRSIQKMLAAYTGERTDDLFLITYGGEAVFGSRLLLDADDVALDGDTQTLGGEEYHLTAQARDDRGFAYRIYATHASLYSSGNLLVAINLAVMFCFLALGMFVVWYISKERYRDYIRAGDFVRKLDDMGSRMMGKEVYVARYEDMQNYIQLHLSENELKERTLELETLRHQLNPHLLLNTLQTMNWRLIREFGGHTEVNVTIENLCRILSYTLYPADTLARMEEEIQYTNAYIALQSHKLPENLAVDWQISPEAGTLRVPRLIFQPIVENACKYAFTQTRNKPEILIAMQQDGDSVRFTVQDNGCGMPEDALQAVRARLGEAPKGNSGIGLYNTHKRIQLLFGSRYGLSIESSWGTGTRVTIHLPAITDL